MTQFCDILFKNVDIFNEEKHSTPSKNPSKPALKMKQQLSVKSGYILYQLRSIKKDRKESAQFRIVKQNGIHFHQFALR